MSTRAHPSVRSTPLSRGWLVAPSAAALFVWMAVPLALTFWFSLQRYTLLAPDRRAFIGWDNYARLVADPALWTAMANTVVLVGAVLAITVGAGMLVAALLDQPFRGRRIARLLAVAPFFVMPTVAALVWKNLLMHPVNGLLAVAARLAGLPAVDWMGDWPLASIVLIVAWQWTPFAIMVFLTAMQSIAPEIREAARIDGAGERQLFWHIVVPHLRHAAGVVVMVEAIFLLTVFAEILVTTAGGPGLASTNLAYLIYIEALLNFDIGSASAGGIVAIVLANVVAFFLLRTIARGIHG